MTAVTAVGVVLLAVPTLAILAVFYIMAVCEYGWRVALALLGTTLAVVALVVTGAFLIEGGQS